MTVSPSSFRARPYSAFYLYTREVARMLRKAKGPDGMRRPAPRGVCVTLCELALPPHSAVGNLPIDLTSDSISAGWHCIAYLGMTFQEGSRSSGSSGAQLERKGVVEGNLPLG